MTREQAKELLPIINAFAEGKQIEYYDSSVNAWLSANSPTWRSEFTYRVKPEKKLIPFTFEDKDLFKGKFVKYVKSDDMLNHYCINGFGKEYIQLSNGKTHFYETMLALYEFEDGSPCGKLIEE